MWRVVVVALCGATASPRRLRTQRRTTASGRATIEACDDTIYYTEVTLGGQALQLVVDTGSSDLWVAGKDCNACTQTIYDRDASPTYASDGARVEIAYADGDSVVGVAARDTLGWGGVATANQSFVEVDASNFWICGDEDGVLGLGPSAGASSAFERMASGLDAPVLGIALRDGGAGEVSLGGVDAEAFVGDLTWLPVADGDVPLWSATLDAVVYRKAAASGEARLAGGVALFDTGTTFLVAPPSDALTVMAAVGATCYAYLDGGTYDIAPCGDLEADAQVDIAVAPCDAAASDAGLAFEFGGASFDLPAEAYVSEQDCGDGEFLDCRGLCWPDAFLEYARDDSCDDGRLGPDLFCVERGCDGGACADEKDACDPGVSEPRCYVDVDQGREGEWILGDALLKRYYFAVNVRDRTIGLAKSRAAFPGTAAAPSPAPSAAPSAAPSSAPSSAPSPAPRRKKGGTRATSTNSPLGAFVFLLFLASVFAVVCSMCRMARSAPRNRGYEYNDPDDDEYLQDPSWARTPRIMKRDSPGSGRRFFPRVELPTRRRRADDADAAPVVATREETVSALHASRSEADIWGAAPNVEEPMFEEVEL